MLPISIFAFACYLAIGIEAMVKQEDPECCAWARRNQCTENPRYMRVQCPDACGTPGATVQTAALFADNQPAQCRPSTELSSQLRAAEIHSFTPPREENLVNLASIFGQENSPLRPEQNQNNGPEISFQLDPISLLLQQQLAPRSRSPLLPPPLSETQILSGSIPPPFVGRGLAPSFGSSPGSQDINSLLIASLLGGANPAPVATPQAQSVEQLLIDQLRGPSRSNSFLPPNPTFQAQPQELDINQLLLQRLGLQEQVPASSVSFLTNTGGGNTDTNSLLATMVQHLLQRN